MFTTFLTFVAVAVTVNMVAVYLTPPPATNRRSLQAGNGGGGGTGGGTGGGNGGGGNMTYTPEMKMCATTVTQEERRQERKNGKTRTVSNWACVTFTKEEAVAACANALPRNPSTGQPVSRICTTEESRLGGVTSPAAILEANNNGRRDELPERCSTGRWASDSADPFSIDTQNVMINNDDSDDGEPAQGVSHPVSCCAYIDINLDGKAPNEVDPPQPGNYVDAMRNSPGGQAWLNCFVYESGSGDWMLIRLFGNLIFLICFPIWLTVRRPARDAAVIIVLRFQSFSRLLRNDSRSWVFLGRLYLPQEELRKSPVQRPAGSVLPAHRRRRPLRWWHDAGRPGATDNPDPVPRRQRPRINAPGKTLPLPCVSTAFSLLPLLGVKFTAFALTFHCLFTAFTWSQIH